MVSVSGRTAYAMGVDIEAGWSADTDLYVQACTYRTGHVATPKGATASPALAARPAVAMTDF